VGPELAEKLGLPQITYALDLEVADGMVRATREWEDGDEVVEARMRL
jgi:electron transfer flavoprotein beta subunit